DSHLGSVCLSASGFALDAVTHRLRYSVVSGSTVFLLSAILIKWSEKLVDDGVFGFARARTDNFECNRR
ncbi:hypothetical protein J6590_107371, partial [Homalodisca vitripennis]